MLNFLMPFFKSSKQATTYCIIYHKIATYKIEYITPYYIYYCVKWAYTSP